MNFDSSRLVIMISITLTMIIAVSNPVLDSLAGYRVKRLNLTSIGRWVPDVKLVATVNFHSA